jgi:hypothetical protein
VLDARNGRDWPVRASVSFNRPGGNFTGATMMYEINGKRLELLREMFPRGHACGGPLQPPENTAS